MRRSNKIWDIGVFASLFTCGCFLFFQYFYPYHLFFKEQTLLFLFTSDYFLSYFDKPAWLACYLGDYLTQFFYLRGGGATVITTILLLQWWLIRCVLKRFTNTWLSILALFPTIIELTLLCDLYYPFANTVSITIVLLYFLFFTKIRETNFSTTTAIISLLSVPVLYNLVGISFFIFPVLVILFDIRQGRNQWFLWILLIILAGLTPLLSQSVNLLTLRQAYLYPLTSLKHFAAILSLLPILFYVQIQDSNRPKLSSLSSAIIKSSLLLIVFIGGIWSFANFDREKRLSLATEAYFENWDKLIHLADGYKLSDITATYYTNLALSHKGELPDKLLNHYQPASNGLFLSVNPQSDWITIFFSNDVFFYLGDMNLAQHSAMLGKIFSPKSRSSRMIRRLTEISLVNEDTAVAEKYLRMLDATLFHKKWAESYREMITSDTLDVNTGLNEIQLRTITTDTLRGASDYPISLNLLIESNPNNSFAMNYLLCYHLLNKDILSFKNLFDRFCMDNPAYLSKVYMEALLIRLATDKASPQMLQAYGIPNNIVTDFMEYTRLYEQSEGDMALLGEKYRFTYWYYYHFAQIKMS